jgi:hypothetical protein
VKTERALVLLALFSLGWLGFSLVDFYFTMQNSDCGYTVAETCTQFARAEQQIVIWRGLAIELAAILAVVLIRKR